MVAREAGRLFAPTKRATDAVNLVSHHCLAIAGTTEHNTSFALSVIGLAVICTAIAFLLFFALIAEVGPVRATVITYVNPAVAAVLGVTVLGEHVTWGMGVGFMLVLIGCVLATGGGPETVAES